LSNRMITFREKQQLAAIVCIFVFSCIVEVGEARKVTVSLPADVNKDQAESDPRAVEVGRSRVTARKIFVLFGPPGAGKGTQSPRLEYAYGIPTIGTGAMLRSFAATGSELGLKVTDTMASGNLIDDETMLAIVAARIVAADCRFGFVLDGFPRTVPQAVALDSLLATGGDLKVALSALRRTLAGGSTALQAEPEDKIEGVIALEVPNSVLEERVCGRWVHERSGRSYHVSLSPPKSLLRAGKGQTPAGGIRGNMFDDVSGGALVQRGDDTPGALQKRLKYYHDQTAPVLARYDKVCPERVIRVNGNQSADLVWGDLCTRLKLSKL